METPTRLQALELLMERCNPSMALRLAQGYRKGEVFIDEALDAIEAALAGHQVSDRDAGGRIVHQTLARIRNLQPSRLLDWQQPFDDLDEAEKEVLRQVYDTCMGTRLLNGDIADAARVIAWAQDPKRKPAALAFTAGPERQAAFWIEWAWANRS